MAQTDEVKLHFLDYWRVIRVHWVLIGLAFLLMLLTAAIVGIFPASGVYGLELHRGPFNR